LDNTQGRKKIKEESRDVGFTGETDRIYLHTADQLRLNDTGMASRCERNQSPIENETFSRRVRSML
jgi:D-hexose-6-phosphate mutarotase